MSIYPLAKPLLFALDPETAHDLTIKALANTPPSWLRCALGNSTPSEPIQLLGMSFPNRVGLAAGLDKNAACIDGMAALGFGFIEVGTVTPRPQPGNPKPRLFRLPQAKALINRFGFNNLGLDAFVRNVRNSQVRQKRQCILGLNLGKNADTPIEQAASDYLIGLRAVYPYADYITINISSPNTKNLRQLQAGHELDELLAQIVDERAELQATHGTKVPLLVKIAPDLEPAQLDVIVTTLQRRGIDGVIATNTTLARSAVAHLQHGQETGGLSGSPVLAASNNVIRGLRQRLGPDYPIIGVGGVLTGDDAVSKIQAGAQLVQLYTGLIYRGPELIGECLQALAQASLATKTAQ